MCVCNMSVRGVESGHYIPPLPPGGVSSSQSNGLAQALSPTGTPQYKCSCGFSAVRYRYVSQHSSAYVEDDAEITGADVAVLEAMRRRPQRFDAQLAELIRQQSTSRDMTSQIIAETYLERECSEATMLRGRLDIILKSNFDYKVTKMDINDIKVLFNMAMDTACRAMESSMPSTQSNKTSAVSWWAYQRGARELVSCNASSKLIVDDLQREPTETETMSILTSIRNSLHTHAPRWASLLPIYTPSSTGATVTTGGPLTWRQFEKRLGRPSALTRPDAVSALIGRPEPVPDVVVQTESRDFVAVSPLALKLWDRLLLEPYSAPKDVVYVAITPDLRTVAERTRQFLRELSKTYENHRFGRHCALARPKTLPDALFKVDFVSMSHNPDR